MTNSNKSMQPIAPVPLTDELLVKITGGASDDGEALVRELNLGSPASVIGNPLPVRRSRGRVGSGRGVGSAS